MLAIMRSKHLSTGYVNELEAHLTQLTEVHKALSEALDSNDDDRISQQVDDASKAIDAMTKGAIKTIKPQLAACHTKTLNPKNP